MSAETVQSSKDHDDQRVPSNDFTLIDIYIQFSETYKVTLLMNHFTFRGVDRKPTSDSNRVNAPNLAALDDDISRLGGSLSFLCESNYPPVVPYKVKKAIQPHFVTNGSTWNSHSGVSFSTPLNPGKSSPCESFRGSTQSE